MAIWIESRNGRTFEPEIADHWTGTLAIARPSFWARKSDLDVESKAALAHLREQTPGGDAPEQLQPALRIGYAGP